CIDDTVHLFYKIVDEAAIATRSPRTDDLLSSYSLVTALDILDQKSRLMMNRVERKEPEIAEYLKLMESKISFLAQAVMKQGNDFTDRNMRKANISASGLAFESDAVIETGQFLEIKLLLTSCLAGIYCKAVGGGDIALPFQIGIDYVNLQEQDREVLIKHVVKRQMQQIREQKRSLL
ncbi:MAG TPA: PilZ domain-containing protein, partial [Methylococcaceae bacterium]|nr:PilZ domain-containing protein [Methylococcaceae bacterium]